MQYVWNAYYSGTSFCLLKIEIVQFPNGFHLNTDFVRKEKYLVKEWEGKGLGELVDQYKIPGNWQPTPTLTLC